jgi:hypothetical protein
MNALKQEVGAQTGQPNMGPTLLFDGWETLSSSLAPH